MIETDYTCKWSENICNSGHKGYAERGSDREEREKRTRIEAKWSEVPSNVRRMFVLCGFVNERTRLIISSWLMILSCTTFFVLILLSLSLTLLLFLLRSTLLLSLNAIGKTRITRVKRKEVRKNSRTEGRTSRERKYNSRSWLHAFCEEKLITKRGRKRVKERRKREEKEKEKQREREKKGKNVIFVTW